MRFAVLATVLAVTVAGCSKKSDSASIGGSAAAPATGGSGADSASATPGTGDAPAKPPTMTPERFVAEPTQWTIQALDRGLWISDGGGPFSHACRVDLGLAMGRAGKVRAVAMANPAAATCEARGSFAVCTVTAPDGSGADHEASWVFASDDDSGDTVLVAVVFGSYDWAKVSAAIPAKEACPRPSASP